jgi:hypothetical protein
VRRELSVPCLGEQTRDELADRAKANLALARHNLKRIDGELIV